MGGNWASLRVRTDKDGVRLSEIFDPATIACQLFEELVDPEADGPVAFEGDDREAFERLYWLVAEVPFESSAHLVGEDDGGSGRLSSDLSREKEECTS